MPQRESYRRIVLPLCQPFPAFERVHGVKGRAIEMIEQADGFETFFRLEYPTSFPHVSRPHGRRSLAEDLTQEALLKHISLGARWRALKYQEHGLDEC